MSIDRVALDIRDATDTPLQGTIQVTLTAAQWPPQVTIVSLPAAPGALPLLPPSTTAVDVTITSSDYASFAIHLSFDPNNTVYWSNAACLCTVSGSTVTLKAMLGRVRGAPCTLPPYGGKAHGDQSGVFVLETVTRNPMSGIPPEWGFTTLNTKRRYAGLDLLVAPKSVRRLVEHDPGQATATVLSSANTDGWNRFHFDDAPTDLTKQGRFLWLEYGGVGGPLGTISMQTEPRFLVAVWAPPPPIQIPKEGLDIALFYSPSTATAGYPPSSPPFRSNYPYVVDQDSLAQPYVKLGYGYIFSTLFAHLLSTLSDPPILVMPIFPNCAQNQNEQWQPFNSQAGVHRLLLEVALFLIGQGYGQTSDSIAGWNGAKCQTGAVPAPEIQNSQFISGTSPKLRNVALAGFSSGSMGLLPIFANTQTSGGRYKAPLFGTNLSGFDDVWREIWGLDLYFGRETGLSSRAFENTLLRWSKEGRERRFRLYQSGYTLGNATPSAFYPSLRKASQTPVRLASSTDSALWAEDWRDPTFHWSASFFSKHFLKATAPNTSINPAFPANTDDDKRVHPFTAMLGFGHASSLRFTR